MKRQKIRDQRGITLIALVITIILMILLVGVTIRLAIQGGLFNYAKTAKEETIAKRDDELTLSEGQITIDGKTYDSHQDYLDGNDTWKKILATKTSPHPDQQNSQDIGVGTDGELVNLDLWNYEHIDRRRMESLLTRQRRC